MISDFHIHTQFSSDSEAEPEKIAEQAVRLGLDTICFTDHFDKDYPDYGDGIDFSLDVEQYCQKVRKLQREYQKKLDIRFGVELGLQPYLGEYYKAYVAKYPFDFVIGSVHLVDGEDPYYGYLFQNRSDIEAYRRFFEGTLENVKNHSEFDVLGHLDYVVRYGKTKAENYSCLQYADIIDEILKYLIECGKGLELNTSGFKFGMGFGHPHPDILKRYRELGGEIITIGSDAHKPDHIAYGFQRVSDILKACGFKNYTEFRERKAIFRQLP